MHNLGGNMNEYTKQQYGEMVKQMSPDSPIVTNCIKAFCVGGIISVIGQLITNFLSGIGLNTDITASYTAIILIFIGVSVTGFNLYSKLGKFAGAGSIVPITGFANAIAAAAIEFKKEGLVLGLGSKIFTLAGSVIVYGVTSSFIIGLIYYITKII